MDQPSRPTRAGRHLFPQAPVRKPTVPRKTKRSVTISLEHPLDDLLRSLSQHPTTPVLLIGQGAFSVAERLHRLTYESGTAPFVHVDCVWLPSRDSSSFLFGKESAGEVRLGVIEKAESGTLLMDNIEELPAPDQSRLAGVIDEASFRRIGSSKKTNLSVRVVVATSYEPEELVRTSRLRLDLLERVNVFPIRLP